MDDELIGGARLFRKDIFCAIFLAMDSYRDTYIEVKLQHKSLGDISFVCKKQELTEAQQKENEEERYEKNRRGDNRYLVIGFVHETDLKDASPDKIKDMLYKGIVEHFSYLEQSYQDDPKGTHPVILNIRTIDSLDEYVKSHNINNFDPQFIPDFLQPIKSPL